MRSPFRSGDRPRSRGWASVVLGAVLLGPLVAVGACGSGGGTTPAVTPTTAGGPVTGPLTVLAAASLTGAFNKAKGPLTGTYPGLDLSYDFGGSNALVAQILQGAPADVFASADTQNMQKLIDAGLVERPATFARNKLEIAVAAGNPKRITGLADLAKPGVGVVLGAPGVPAGDYARQALAKANVNVAPKSLETDVKAALAKVTSGEADATIVYVTDVAAAGPAIVGVSVPDADQPAITYPIAVIKTTKHRPAAEAFVTSAVSGEVQQALEAAGFFPPR